VLEEPPWRPPSSPPRAHQVLPLSARTPGALAEVALAHDAAVALAGNASERDFLRRWRESLGGPPAPCQG
jgi:acyl transferase domain-containing protein